MSVEVIVRSNHFRDVARKLPRTIEKRRRAAIAAGVTVARREARVRTGFMRDNIHETDEGFVSEALYSLFNEFGTRFMTAKPFMHPGAKEAERHFLASTGGIEGELA